VREPGLAPEPADVERRLEQVPDAREALVLARRLEVDRNPVEHLLRGRRFPADWRTRSRSSAGRKTCSFRNVLTSSTPAFVRVSERKTRPSWSRIARQYVTGERV
jgi:hypothetical protein